MTPSQPLLCSAVAKPRFGFAILALGTWFLATQSLAAQTAGMSYTNVHLPKVPWSIHIVRFDRQDPAFAVHSAHAEGKAVGMDPLIAQVKRLDPKLGVPVAAINGDFYQRDRAYAGDPRGLQIAAGELISAPTGGVAFWIAPGGSPHVANVASRFQIVWPDNSKYAFGLNSERPADGAVLYTPAVGQSTRTTSGREFVLEQLPGTAWRPLRVAETYRARVREVRDQGDTPLAPDTLVLSIGPKLAPALPKIEPGAVLEISTACLPDLRGATTAIGGGPVLVRRARRQRIEPPSLGSYAFSSMRERHPRSAIGWNDSQFFLVEVDGRQEGLSAGMTLEALSAYLADLGCEEAMNLDGGGSATLWFEGQVRNSPCDGQDRPIANSLIVVRNSDVRAPAAASAGQASK